MFELANTFGAELIEQNTKGDVVLQHADGGLIRFAYGELPGVCFPFFEVLGTGDRLICEV